jgi:hypothetical protein
MKFNRHSHLLWAAAIACNLATTTYAQDERRAAVRPMDRALNRKETIAAGLAGEPFRKSMRPFERSMVQPAAASNQPGLKGHFERKEPQSLQGPIDPATALVKINSHPSFVEMTDAARARSGSRGSAQALDFKPRASSSDPRAYLIFPANGSTLAPVQSFTWSAGYQADDYWMWIGSCQDCADIVNQDMGLTQSFNANVPSDGRALFVTLFTAYLGRWYWVDYQFAASSSQPQPSQMISPIDGATLTATQAFTWTAGALVGEYYLWIGNCQDCNDILNESEGQKLSRNVALPTDGRTIYVTLFSSIGGLWYWYDYQYRAASTQVHTPRIYVTNNLDYTINVLVNGNVVGSVSPWNTQFTDVTVSSLSVSFELVQPTLSGRVLGDPMTGVFQTIYNPAGSYSFTVGTLIGQQWYFEPLITNYSDIPLDIEVNSGLEAENRCTCNAPAGSTNVTTGYYKLFSNGNVRLFRGGSGYSGRYWFWGTDSTGYVSTGGTLPGYVDGTGRAYFTANSEP